MPLRLDDVELGHVPLREHRQGRATGLAGDVGNGEVLLDDAFGRIEQHESDIGPLGGLERAQLRVVLDPLPLLPATAEPRRVDEHERGVPALQDRVDGVAGGARHLGDDHALAPDEPVQERGLADVRTAEDRDADRLGPDRDLARARQARDDLVEQVARAVTVQPGEGPRVAEAEPVEHEPIGVPSRVVDLVREHDHRPLGGAKDHGELLVAGRYPRPRVDDEQHEVGLVDRRARLLGDLRSERATVGFVDPAGVDQPEPGARSTRRAAPCGPG